MNWLLFFSLAPVLLSAAPQGGGYDSLEPLRPETILLARVKVVASENARRLPDFTCGLSIERTRRSGRTGRFQLVDRIRLEVAYSGGKELYAWPGAKQFEETDLVSMVGNNAAIGTGDFALHVQSALLASGVVHSYRGEEEISGRTLHRFDYKMPRMHSRYQMRFGPLEDIVGYHGSFWVDRTTLDVVRLEIVVDDIPPALPLQASRKVIELSRQPIGASDFLLPATSMLELVLTDGTSSRNTSRFTDCHQFLGESALTFEDVKPDTTALDATIEIHLPERLKLDLSMAEPVDLKSAATGQQLRFTLRKDARQGGGVILPKGAEFLGRIDGVHCIDQPMAYCFLLFHLESFRHASKSGTVQAVLEAPSLEGLTMGNNSRLLLRLSTIPRAPGQSVLPLRGGPSRISAGLQMIWRVTTPQSKPAR